MQTMKIVQILFNDGAGFDMCYEEFKNQRKEAWKEKIGYRKINRLDYEENIVIVRKANQSKKFLNLKLIHVEQLNRF